MTPAPAVAAPGNVDGVVAAWDYDGLARALILALKLRGRRPAGSILADGLAARVWAEGCGADALVWVPGRRVDIRRRGFDHARLLAQGLSSRLGIPSIPVLRRAADRIDQAGLNALQRRSNLAGAFVADHVPTRVAIVDDVMTTGATLSEAGRALRAGGARRVEGLVACRAG